MKKRKKLNQLRLTQRELKRRKKRRLKQLKRKKKNLYVNKESLFPEEKRFKKQFKNWGKKRRKYLQNYYSVISEFDDEQRNISVENNLGIELESDRDYFFSVASELLHGFPEKVRIDLGSCSRIWPSGIMLLNSYYHWFLIKNGEKTETSDVKVLYAPNSTVADYIGFCGFADYVTTSESAPSSTSNIFNDENIIKLQKETTKESYWTRQKEIRDFIRVHSGLSEGEVELFNDRVLTELFGNLSEHGVNYRSLGFDSSILGWYVLVQYHPTTKVINICFADNGIGIANSLRTGPQGQTLIDEFRDIGNDPSIDAKYLLKSLDKDVSGAYDASIYERRKLLHRKRTKGKSRGMGFSRIVKSCEKLGIDFSIISNNAFLFKKSNKNPIVRGFNKRVFAGTMFNLLISVKEK